MAAYTTVADSLAPESPALIAKPQRRQSAMHVSAVMLGELAKSLHRFIPADELRAEAQPTQYDNHDILRFTRDDKRWAELNVRVQDDPEVKYFRREDSASKILTVSGLHHPHSLWWDDCGWDNVGLQQKYAVWQLKGDHCHMHDMPQRPLSTGQFYQWYSQKPDVVEGKTPFTLVEYLGMHLTIPGLHPCAPRG